MKRIVLLALSLVMVAALFVGCAPKSKPQDTYTGPKKVLITDQLNRRLALYDLNKKDLSKPEWTWSTKHENFTSPDGAKYRRDPLTKMDVILFCSSGGYSGIVSYPAGELISEVPNPGGNPHSVELLPDGAFVLAASTGNYVRVYPREAYGDVDISKNYTQIEFRDAHGVLWDDAEQLLWVLGESKLQGFAVTSDHRLVEDPDRSYTLKSSGGHDLQPVYGTEDEFWITTNTNIIRFNKTTGEMSIRYPGWGNISALTTVKGIGNFEDGTLLIAQQNGTFKEWNTNSITVGVYNEDTDLYDLEPQEIPNVAYYKLRVFKKDYR